MVRLVGNFFDDDLFLDIDYERWINILTERKPETETEKLKLYHKSVSPIWYECCHQSLPIILSTNHSHKYRHQFDNNCNRNLAPKYSPPINNRNIATNLIIFATKISHQNIIPIINCQKQLLIVIKLAAVIFAWLIQKFLYEA